MDKGLSLKIELIHIEANTTIEMKQFVLPEEPTFAYCTPTVPETCMKAVKDLDKYLETEEPYDGVIGFSLGATFILSWMVKKIQEKKQGQSAELPFKVGIFFSNAGRLLEYNDTIEQSVTPLDLAEIDGIIDIPTAHIWGTRDPDQLNAQLASQACDEDTRSVFVHERGHEVPMSPENVISAAKVINRAITRAQGFV
ncbi:uncharacterized protein N7506_002674 [Penicillium brevicompactum]|uniref:uncharacterized protein n=1 Tax=Penicillium brevicompactum TaxID=5074 RepID=UPI002540F193|nr:uncharacterized protein N7506_002674 [Penicillium brevicompactum]KAJ5344309.1 hypothetical protein N7506_002674 [Penicillium brevicompactum]